MQSLRKEDAPCRHALEHNTSVLHDNGDIENELHTRSMNYLPGILPGRTQRYQIPCFHHEKSPSKLRNCIFIFFNYNFTVTCTTVQY